MFKTICQNYQNAVPVFSDNSNPEARKYFYERSHELDKNFRRFLERVFMVDNESYFADIIWEKAFVCGHWGGYPKIYEYYKEYRNAFIKNSEQ